MVGTRENNYKRQYIIIIYSHYQKYMNFLNVHPLTNDSCLGNEHHKNKDNTKCIGNIPIPETETFEMLYFSIST